ncbi:MAG TPA: triple tyrosine motif-containing protein, partial [Cytophagaceae bacterium]
MQFKIKFETTVFKPKTAKRVRFLILVIFFSILSRQVYSQQLKLSFKHLSTDHKSEGIQGFENRWAALLPGPNSFLKTDIRETKEITLSYGESVFTFEFAAINYILTDQYAYKMEGFDKDWNYVGSKRMATYTNLDPGEYIFRVKAAN